MASPQAPSYMGGWQVSHQQHMTHRHSGTWECHAVCDSESCLLCPLWSPPSPRDGPSPSVRRQTALAWPPERQVTQSGHSPGGIPGGRRPPDPSLARRLIWTSRCPPFQKYHSSEPPHCANSDVSWDLLCPPLCVTRRQSHGRVTQLRARSPRRQQGRAAGATESEP